MEGFVILGAIALLAVIAGVLVVKRVIYICDPNEVLIFSGPRRVVDGRVVGYKLVHGGRRLRIPLLEEVHRLDLTNMIIDLRVVDAYSKGGIPLTVQGVANIKIASQEPAIGNAIERFLGKSREEIMSIAQETLEGNLRGVLATLTPEEVNQDRVKFARSLLHEGEQDLLRLGLVLDTLKIQNVSDDKGYLDSIGRKQTAELQRRSRIAEAENRALAAIRDAKNMEEREIARIDAEIAIARAEAERRIVDAQTRKEAMIAEQKSAVTAAIAKAQAELEVQQARIEQVKLQLMADKVKPAEARKQEMVATARGQAARIVEEGRATAASLKEMATTWQRAGRHAREIFLTQKLDALIATMVKTLGDVKVDRLTMIDRGVSAGGSGGQSLAVKATVLSEQLKQTLGIDLPALVRGLGTTPDIGTPSVESPGVAPSSPRPEPPVHGPSSYSPQTVQP